MLLIGLVLAIVFMFIVMRWWSEGIVEACDAFLLIAVFGGLIVGMFAANNPVQFMFAFIPLASAAAYAIYSYKVGGLNAYYKNCCENYMRAIQADPRNRAAREYLADALYNMGQLDRAIDELQVSVNMGSGIEHQYKLNKWLKEQHFRDTNNPVCRWCQTENAMGAKVCVKCGSDLPYDNAFSRWLMGGGKAGMRYYLLIIIGIALIGVSLLFLPLQFAFIPVVMFCLMLVGWWLLCSARS